MFFILVSPITIWKFSQDGRFYMNVHFIFDLDSFPCILHPAYKGKKHLYFCRLFYQANSAQYHHWSCFKEIQGKNLKRLNLTLPYFPDLAIFASCCFFSSDSQVFKQISVLSSNSASQSACGLLAHISNPFLKKATTLLEWVMEVKQSQQQVPDFSVLLNHCAYLWLSALLQGSVLSALFIFCMQTTRTGAVRWLQKWIAIIQLFS